MNRFTVRFRIEAPDTGVSPSGKAQDFDSCIPWVRIPPPQPQIRLKEETKIDYLTYFSLEVENDQRFKRKIIEALHNIIYHDECNLFSNDEYEDIDYGKALFHDSLYWFDWYDDMILLSKEFPECTFHLEGFGDDHDDWWQAHFKNGYGYQQMAVIPPFDPAKLKMEDTCLGIDEVI